MARPPTIYQADVAGPPAAHKKSAPHRYKTTAYSAAIMIALS
jgi:hypothetical protein